MAGSMQKIIRGCLPKAIQVIDRFHVQKLAYDALQDLRISWISLYSWGILVKSLSLQNEKEDR